MNSHPSRNVQGKSLGLRLALIGFLLLMSGLSSYAAPLSLDAAGFEVVKLSSEALSVPADFAHATPASDNPKMDADLAKLAAASRTSAARALDLARASSFRLAGNRVQVKITARSEGAGSVTLAVMAAGGEVTGSANGDRWLQAWLPLDALDAIAAEADVEYISRPAEAELMVTTEGLAVINGPAWHSAGYRGAGVKVAIIDGGFEGYPALRGTELPATVTVKNFVDRESDAQVDGTTEHGTACAEIVHDIAPNASLYLAKIGTDIDLQEAVNWAIAQNVNIISTSLGWYNLTPGDGTGFFANLVQSARTAGIFWTTAASNDREAHWGGAYSDPDSDSYHNFNGAQEINYFGPGNGDAYLIPAGNAIRVFLRWDDWTAVNQNYDLYLVRWNGSAWQTVASGTNAQNGGAGQTPTEHAGAMTSGSDAPYGFIVQRYSSDRNVNLEIFTPKVARLDEIVTARSLANLADSPAAMTAAAVDVTAPYPQESYSSEGPANGPGGTAAGGAVKPDISGFANVSTMSYPDPADKFAGTSSATPHVAGAAALVKSAYPAYTPAQIQSFLEGRAIDMGIAGKDTLYGYGRLHLGAPPQQAPDMNIVKRAVGSNFVPGGPIQFTLTIANTGNAAASQIVITDLVSSQVTNLSYSSTLPITKASGASYTWNLASLAAGASGTITINGNLSASLPPGFKVVNTATVSAPNDNNPANNSSSITVPGNKIYLPLVMLRWPPIPEIPVLNLISNPDGDGSYDVTWNPANRATAYTLRESFNDANFSSAATVYYGAGTSWSASGKTPGTYYYQVQAANGWGSSGWSNVQSVIVQPPLPEIPVLNPISNSDGNGSYDVTWNPANRATAYVLRESFNDPSFGSPVTVYDGTGTSWLASGKLSGTYYYSVQATNARGPSGWSNVQSVFVAPLTLPTRFDPIADATIISSVPNFHGGSYSDMLVGYEHCSGAANGIWRSLIRFDLSAIPRGTPITNARLYVLLIESCDIGSRTHTVKTSRITGDWSEYGVAWSNQPETGSEYGSAAVTSGNWDWYSFDVTQLVRDWVNGSFPDYGVMLRGPEASDNSSASLGFSTREFGGNETPYLSVTYAGLTAPEPHSVPATASEPPVCGNSIARSLWTTQSFFLDGFRASQACADR